MLISYQKLIKYLFMRIFDSNMQRHFGAHRGGYRILLQRDELKWYIFRNLFWIIIIFIICSLLCYRSQIYHSPQSMFVRCHHSHDVALRLNHSIIKNSWNGAKFGRTPHIEPPHIDPPHIDPPLYQCPTKYCWIQMKTIDENDFLFWNVCYLRIVVSVI